MLWKIWCDKSILFKWNTNQYKKWKFNDRKNKDIQESVCKLVGSKAKFRGKHKKWWKTQTLYWRGIEIKRNSQEYQDLLDRAYQCMYDQSESFRDALKASMNSTLTHSIGKKNKNETILTVSEFCSRLTNLRDYGKLSF